MTDIPAIAATVRAAIDTSMRHSERSSFSNEKKIGVSDIGHCREYARRMIVGEEFTDEQDSYAAAFIGTAVGDYAEDAVNAILVKPGIKQMEVTVQLELGEGYVLKLIGHPDMVFPKTDTEAEFSNQVWDFKTKDGLAVVRRSGFERRQRFQVTLYAKALIDLGLLDEDATLALVGIDRSGRDPEPYVEEWTYDPAILEEAMEWFRDVLYAVAHGEEAAKDKPRDWCLSFCPYATGCRLGDTDVEGFITDDLVLKAIEAYNAGHAMEKEGKLLKAAAKSDLENVSGHTPTHTLRWIHINESTVPASTRAAYERLDLRPRKGK